MQKTVLCIGDDPKHKEGRRADRLDIRVQRHTGRGDGSRSGLRGKAFHNGATPAQH
jgi:hypothetical protein